MVTKDEKTRRHGHRDPLEECGETSKSHWPSVLAMKINAYLYYDLRVKISKLNQK